MESEIICLVFGLILAFCVGIICLVHMYRKERFRANLLQEQLDIRRQIERGVRVDKILWDYHDVMYLNNTYNIKVKNSERKRRTLKGGKQ